MKKKFAKVDQNVKITNTIIALTQNDGLLPWMKPFNMVGGLSPLNLDSGRKYEGFFNNMLLSMHSGGRLPLFGTFSKAHPAKKGAKSVAIWKPIIRKFEDKTDATKTKTFCAGFSTINVFHYTDLQGIDVEALEAKYAPESNDNALEFNPIAKCEEVVTNMPNCPTIGHNGGNSAYYAPSTDSIELPKQDQFKSESQYYATLFHELAHSTGHFTRLDRFKKTGEEFKLGHKKDYSFEELVAELTACFVSSACGNLETVQMENSASYIKSWVSKLQNNTDWIVKASGYATRATKYILDTQPVKK